MHGASNTKYSSDEELRRAAMECACQLDEEERQSRVDARKVGGVLRDTAYILSRRVEPRERFDGTLHLFRSVSSLPANPWGRALTSPPLPLPHASRLTPPTVDHCPKPPAWGLGVAPVWVASS
eukprot:804360-Pyramimonas_sp.AAC.1